MGVSFYIAIVLQGLLVIWFMSCLHIRKDNYCFFDRESTNALKGYFSIIIVLFHVPVSNVLCNLLGCVTAVIIVTLFSFFSTYGMTVKTQEDMAYVNTIPCRFVKIAVIYGVTLMLKYFITGNMLGGGILWINNLLLSYIVFWSSHLFFKNRYGDYIVIVFWIFYAIIMRWHYNIYFGWPAQSFGFAYGCIIATFSKIAVQFFTRRIKEICVICGFALPVLGIFYLGIHTPECENMEMYIIRVVMSFLLMLLFLTMSVRMRLVSGVMTYIGKISLYIYLLHGMVIDIFKDYLTDGWLILVCVVTTILLAAFYRWIVGKILILFQIIRKRIINGDRA